jgi:hypothetical protein
MKAQRIDPKDVRNELLRETAETLLNACRHARSHLRLYAGIGDEERYDVLGELQEAIETAEAVGLDQ